MTQRSTVSCSMDWASQASHHGFLNRKLWKPENDRVTSSLFLYICFICFIYGTITYIMHVLYTVHICVTFYLYLCVNMYPEYINNPYNSITGQKDLNSHFTKKGWTNAKKNMKMCSTSAVTREMRLKPHWDTTMHTLDWLKF